jgi:sec-independent protein translocase protein TatA
MGALKPWHIIVIVALLVLLFGAKRLPDAARSLGRSLRIIKAETKGLIDDDNDVAEKAEPRQSRQPLNGEIYPGQQQPQYGPPAGQQQQYGPPAGQQQQPQYGPPAGQQQYQQPQYQPQQPQPQQPYQQPQQPFVDPVQRTNDR